ncbi:MAG: putative tellurium resistance membrane protein TerC [Candidatus Azotimanducaceae bacterium]|jgi:predicted tellurium resistance membrane protein TerC
MLEMFLQPEIWVAIITLVFLEIVLGIDNIIFISIAASKLPEELQKKATNIGLILAMVLRVILLFGISYLVAMQSSFWHVDSSWLKVGVTGQSIIMFVGGLFLLYKSTQEIHHKMEGLEDHEVAGKNKKTYTLYNAIVQITLINIVFSFDSILTAVGMTTGINKPDTAVDEALIVMIIAVVLSMVVMLVFANPVSKFVTKHPTVQMLGLSFLILIGFILISEGAHMAHLEILGQKVGIIPKGYLYFTIAFSLGVEAINMKMRKKKIV